jgi:hypothetical protein
MSVANDNIVDQLWAKALEKIMPGQAAGSARTSLGDNVDLFVMQSSTTSVLSGNPAFARVLYHAAYQSAARNGYFIIRRLGMPADFFWKFDQWSDARAFSTMSKVMDRIFAALMTRHNAGLLKLRSVDIERGRFEVTFERCAECQGARSSRPACFFHAGTFAGILGSMLNRQMVAVETACAASGDGPCAFVIGDSAGRRLAAQAGEALDGGPLGLEAPAARAMTDSERSLVDLGYYQLLLASAFLSNLDVLGDACMSAGRKIGRELAAISGGASGDPSAEIARIYRDLRYMDVSVSEVDGETVVTASGAPETLGPMSGAALVPFMCGELESLLSALGGKPVRYAGTSRDGESLGLTFVPEV